MLNWPDEIIDSNVSTPQWNQSGTNICLDFHGDPIKAELVIFSDGNHHMALQETINRFCLENRQLIDVFYVTTPPGPVTKLLESGSLRIGNLILSVKPHLFISPPHVLDKLLCRGFIHSHQPFMKNRGSVLLVKKGNPKQVHSVKDLLRDDVRLFLSNPDNETVSYQGYFDTIKELAKNEGFEWDNAEFGKRIIFGERIHHREAPQSLEDNRADAAMVYYHLALRYIRIFPSLFEMIPLGGTIDNPCPVSEQQISQTNVGLVADGGKWGLRFFDFLMTDKVTKIYTEHGLQRS